MTRTPGFSSKKKAGQPGFFYGIHSVDGDINRADLTNFRSDLIR
jgi:hypothetical protein